MRNDRNKRSGWIMRRLIALLIFCGWVSAGYAQSPAIAPIPTTLKPGDTLSISVMQDPKLDRSVVIDPNGQIAFPLAGHITASGLTPQRLEKILKSRLKRNYQEDDLDVTVALTNAARPDVPEDDLKPKIFITGEVQRPGPYAIRQATTLVQALSLAGGLGPFAARRRIQIHRGAGAEEQIYQFDYKAYESGQNLDANISLQAGDVIIVPERGILE
jgi:polysaccharide biosynthesis/export protein